MKKMGQKRSNYLQIGRRGLFGGVVLNMHMHWKKHETVKVFCKPCKPGQVHEYAQELARLSGGIPLQIIGDDTIIFDCGKNYEQPEVMSPIDTLSKNKVYLCFMKKEKKRSEMHDCYSFCSSFKSIGNANCFDVLPALSVAEKVHVMQVFCKMRCKVEKNIFTLPLQLCSEPALCIFVTGSNSSKVRGVQ